MLGDGSWFMMKEMGLATGLGLRAGSGISVRFRNFRTVSLVKVMAKAYG